MFEGGMAAFPPRKPEQPVFYPVLNLEYADEIAKQWNAERQTASGYVAKFTIDNGYVAQFEPHKVGSSRHVELWIPAEELARFNEHISPPILIVSAHFGENFKGHVPTRFGLQHKDATAQFVALAHTVNYSGMDFSCEISANHVAVFLNYGFWVQSQFSKQGITKTDQERVLAAIRTIWSDTFPKTPLPLTQQ